MNSLQDLTEKKRTFFDTEPTIRVADPLVLPSSRREAAVRRPTDGTHVPRAAMPPPFPPRSRTGTMAAIRSPSPNLPASTCEIVSPSTQGTPDVEEATRMFERTENTAKRWSLPMLAYIGAALVGIVVPIACLLSIRSSSPAASPAPVPASASTSVLIALPISSTPAGASVTLIGNGIATVVGRTPLTIALDPSHTYDIVLALRGHETTMMHVEPHETKVVAVALTTRH